MRSFFNHYVYIGPIIGRVYYISKLINFNYSFVSENAFPNYTNHKEYEQKLDLQANIFFHKRNDYIIKRIIFPLFSVFIILWGLSLIGYLKIGNFNYKFIECLLYTFANTIDVFKLQKCEEYFNSDLLFILLTSFKYFSDFIIGLVLFTLLYSALRYKIKNDFLHFKSEILSLILIWFFGDNGYHLFNNIKKMVTNEYVFSFMIYIIDCSMNLCFLLLYLILYIKIKNYGEKKIMDQLNVFDNFIRSPVNFCYFKDYLKDNPENCGGTYQFYYLFFWKNYSDFKRSFKHNSEKFNRLVCKKFYEEYFVDKNELGRDSINAHSPYISKFRNISYTTNFFYNTDVGITYFSMLLPESILEPIENAAYQDFKIDSRSLFRLYDDAFKYIEAELLNSFIYMMNIPDNIDKLVSLIGSIEFDFSDKFDKFDRTRNSYVAEMPINRFSSYFY